MGTLTYFHTGAKGFSHSRLDALDRCARKFELENKLGVRRGGNSVTFAYGHAFGEGVQKIIEGYTFEETVFHILCTWDYDIADDGYESDIRNNKNYFEVLNVLNRFYIMYINNSDTFMMNGKCIDWGVWEIAYFTNAKGETKPAIELELVIELGNDYFYEGHIDLVLKRKDSDHFAILELKTSSLNNIQPALYGNSPQATGYMMALDSHLVKTDPDATVSFDVFYLIAQAKKQEFVEFSFTKTPLHRAQWITFIFHKMDQVDRLEDMGLPYPPNYHSCFAYNRNCDYYGACHLPNEIIQRDIQDVSFGVNDSEPDILVTLDEIIERQEHLTEIYETEKLVVPTNWNISETDAEFIAGIEIQL